MSMKRKAAIFLFLVLALAAVLVLNHDVSIHEGVDGQYRYVHMPLYVKWTQFLARHYEYARLADEITRGCETGREKTLAILGWTRRHLKDVPVGMPVCDDHILYTIIRGYGVPEQFQDVFTTLCVYAGVPSFFTHVYSKDRSVKYALSLVRIDGKWRVIDAYRGAYFTVPGGEIAAVEDFLADAPMAETAQLPVETIHGIPCAEFYADLRAVSRPATLRAEKQMPLQRIYFEAKKALGIEKED